jgi:hypothetical protein
LEANGQNAAGKASGRTIGRGNPKSNQTRPIFFPKSRRTKPLHPHPNPRRIGRKYKQTHTGKRDRFSPLTRPRRRACLTPPSPRPRVFFYPPSPPRPLPQPPPVPRAVEFQAAGPYSSSSRSPSGCREVSAAPDPAPPAPRTAVPRSSSVGLIGGFGSCLVPPFFVSASSGFRGAAAVS